MAEKFKNYGPTVPPVVGRGHPPEIPEQPQAPAVEHHNAIVRADTVYPWRVRTMGDLSIGLGTMGERS